MLILLIEAEQLSQQKVLYNPTNRQLILKQEGVYLNLSYLLMQPNDT